MTTVNEEVCELALFAIGKKKFSSLTDGSAAAVACNQVYPRLLRTYLESYSWDYLVVKKSLSPEDEDSILPEYKYAFKKPVDLLRIVRVIDKSSGSEDTSEWLDERFSSTDYSADVNRWAAENGARIPPVNFKDLYGKIHTNFTPIDLLYTQFDDTISRMPTHVFDGLVSALALSLVMPLTKDLKLYKTIEENHMRTMTIAEETESHNEYNTQPSGSSYEDARN